MEEPDSRDLQRLVESTQQGDPQRVPPPHLGHTLGRYRLLDRLGAGAMGTVYRAHDLGANRQVALKVPQVVQGGTQVARLVREGQAAAALDHPGIVRVHELGEAGGIPFLACELVEGARTYDEVVSSRSVRQRVEDLRGVAEAVGHAHRNGVTHRDLKAENLLVDAAGRIRVADFGLAKLVGLETLTRTGALVGTPRTMSPEQVAGSNREVGPGTDVWALGVVLYQAVTGEYPFDGESLVELASAITRQAPASPRSLEPEVWPSLSRAILRSLAKDPEKRYADGAALAEALEACLSDDGADRTVPLVAGLAAALVLLVVTSAVLLRGGGSGPSPKEAPPGPSAAPPTVDAPPELTHEQVSAGDQALRALRAEPSPQGQVSGVSEWLVTYPGHPRTKEAVALRDEAQLEFPLAVVEGEVGIDPVAFCGRRVLVSEAAGRLRLHEPTGELLRAWQPEVGRSYWAHSRSEDHASVVLLGHTGVLLWLDPAAPESSQEHALPFLEGVGGANERGEQAQIHGLALHPTEPLAAVGGPSPGPHLVRRSGEVLTHLVREQPHDIYSLAFSPDGRRLAYGTSWSREGEDPAWLRVVDVSSGEALGEGQSVSKVKRLIFLPGGGLLAGTSDGNVVHYPADDLRQGRRLKRADLATSEALFAPMGHESHLGSITDMVLAKGGTVLYSLAAVEPDYVAEIRGWDLARGRELPEVDLPRGLREAQGKAYPRRVDVSADGRLLLLSFAKRFEVWTLPVE